MAERRYSKTAWIVTLAAMVHLAAVLIATACLWWLGNWDRYRDGLTLTLRIIWGVWILHLLSAILTRVTIFGWTFRRYFRLDEGGGPPPPPLRPIKAPWFKSGKVSFSITVVLVSLFGACAIATAVMYMLVGVTGWWVFWVVFKSVWASCWVLSIAVVLTRLAIFGSEKKKAATTPPADAPAAGDERVAAGKSSEGGS